MSMAFLHTRTQSHTKHIAPTIEVLIQIAPHGQSPLAQCLKASTHRVWLPGLSVRLVGTDSWGIQVRFLPRDNCLSIWKVSTPPSVPSFYDFAYCKLWCHVYFSDTTEGQIFQPLKPNIRGHDQAASSVPCVSTQYQLWDRKSRNYPSCARSIHFA